MKHYYVEFVLAGTRELRRGFYMFSSRLALANYIQEYHGLCAYLKIEEA